MNSNSMIEYTLEEVAKHKSKEDAWLIVEGWVINVSQLWGVHPGGDDVLAAWLGRDATTVFHSSASHVHSQSAQHLLAQFRCGVLKGAKSPQEIDHALSTRPLTAEDYGIDTRKGLLWQAALLGSRYPRFLHDVLIARGGLRYFDNDILESLSRSPWWTVPLVWLPVVLFLSLLARSWGISSLLVLALELFLVGPFLWTLLEYSLHRHVFHMSTHSFAWNYFHMLLHGYHHVCPMDAGRLTFPPLPAAIIYIPVHATLVTLLGVAHGTGCMAGVVLGYVLYDCTHFWLHHADPHSLINFHRSLKRHHLFHHFKNPNSNFGISSYIADWIFQTFDQEETEKGTKLATQRKP